MQEIPLTDEERSAVEDGIGALKSLNEQNGRYSHPRRSHTEAGPDYTTKGIDR